MGTEFARLAGGKAANVAYLASKLGIDARLFAHAGDDDLAEQALASLRTIGVDLSGVRKIAHASTGVAMIVVPSDGNKGIVLSANANAAWTDQDMDSVTQAIDDAPPGSVLVVDCELAGFAVERAVHAASRCGIKIVLDPSPADRVTDTLLRLSDFITPNAGEAKRLTGIECHDVASALHAARRLHAHGAKTACIKLPDGGCVLALAGDRQAAHIPPLPINVTDTTGAGDAFAGALAVAILEQRSLIDALRFAVAASHLTVTRYGAQPALPTREQIDQLAKRFDVNTEITLANP